LFGLPLLLALLGAGCSDSGGGRSGGVEPSGPDAGEGEGEVVDEQPAARRQYRADSLEVLPPDQGMDFDGDGDESVDNGLGSLFLDPLLAIAFGDPNDFLRKSSTTAT
jgi:hypothetical protein